MKIFYTTQFKKDYKRIKKQRKEISKLISVIDQLASAQKLEKKYQEHQLSGEWKNHKNCHVEPDWILIFRLTEDALILER